jgi:hypothetical protein
MRLLTRGLAATSIAILIFACSGSSDNTLAIDDAGTTGDDATVPPAPPGPLSDANLDTGNDSGPACGRLTTPCKTGEHCDGAPDCESKVCRNNKCEDAAPADGVKNGDETDIDCGGSKAPACADGKGCAIPADCTSGVCTGNVCQVPTDSDGVKNGDETGVDCGGVSPKKCPAGEGCNTTADCDNVKCDTAAHKCLAASHSDGIKNAGETGIDCGGAGGAPKCPPGQGCAADADCNNVKCDVGVSNLCLPPSHTDGLKNGDETGVDCGGPTAPNRCPTGQGCAATSDCDNVKCDVGATNLCLPPSHTDGLKNGDETGIDCGGPTAPTRCPPGQGCATDGDCANVRCNLGTFVCNSATSGDGLKNGTETDVDCGGGPPTNAPGCPEDKTCLADGDCASTFCNTNIAKCVGGRSCKTATTPGIVTCGKRDTTDATHVHESCCHSLPLPSVAGVKLDKYEVTSGRFRQFVNAVGPNMRAWAKNEIALNTPTGQRLATDMPPVKVGVNTVTAVELLPASAVNNDPLNIHVQIGMTVMDPRTPSDSQGCFNDGGTAFGANTWYWDQATLQGYFGAGFSSRRFSQASYDEKPINCAAYWMYAAFCAWDGGRMPTQAEVNDAWGATTYPWNSNTFGFSLQPGGVYPFESTANYFNNSPPAGHNYGYPGAPDGQDEAGEIAAPGRFLMDKTFRTSANGESWMDLGANVMELVRAPNALGGGTFCDFSVQGPGDVLDPSCTDPDNGNHGVLRATGIPNTGWVGGSWEGHSAFSTSGQPFFTKNSYNLPIHTQYGKTGVRCAR